MTPDNLSLNREFSLEQIRPSWIEVNLDALEYNARSFKDYIGKDTKLMAVVKANAYSHGIVESAKALLSGGADYLGVATLSEAMKLRTENIQAPILILGFTPNSQLGRIIDMDLTQTVFSLEQARILSKEASLRNTYGNIHIKIDTGMSRLGFLPNEESLKIIKEINSLPNINIEGIFSHFSHSDAEDKSFTDEQFNQFTHFLDLLENESINIPIKHISNAAAVIDKPEYNLDMVRVGISLFGIYPAGYTKRENIVIQPSIEVKAKISSIKEVPKGTSIGYNRAYTTSEKTKIATLPIGYADGYTQDIASLIDVAVNNIKTKVIGRVCMDQVMVDITNIPNLSVEDEVNLISHNDSPIMNTHFVANLSSRLPRVYLKNGKIVKVVASLQG